MAFGELWELFLELVMVFVWSNVGDHITHEDQHLFYDTRFAAWSRPREARPKTTSACIQLSVPLHSACIPFAVSFD